MEMKSMKLDPVEVRAEMSPTSLVDQPEYPYGLCLSLEGDQLKALGVPALPAVGQTMLVQARVLVQSVSQFDTLNGDKEQRVSLQITDMGLEADNSKPPLAQRLYGEND